MGIQLTRAYHAVMDPHHAEKFDEQIRRMKEASPTLRRKLDTKQWTESTATWTRGEWIIYEFRAGAPPPGPPPKKTPAPIFSRRDFLRRPKSGWWWNGERVKPRDFMALAAENCRAAGCEIPDEDYFLMVEKRPGPHGNHKANAAWRRAQWRKMRDFLRAQGVKGVW